jgi:diguanylate cyclase
MSVRHNVKGKDTAARYGGEEFAVILPNTVLRAAVTVAEHIRRAVMAKELMKRSTGEHLGRMLPRYAQATPVSRLSSRPIRAFTRPNNTAAIA